MVLTANLDFKVPLEPRELDMVAPDRAEQEGLMVSEVREKVKLETTAFFLC